jgi:DNA processing protein
MTIFGIAEAQVAELVRALTPGELDRDGIVDRFARAAWSTIAEPGDGDAGRLVGGLGPAAALEALRSRVDPARLTEQLAAAEDAHPVDLRDGLARWTPRLDARAVLRALQQAARFGARLLIPGDETWPTGLDDLGPHAPFALWVRGDPLPLGGLERSIAIVGARAATGYGEHVTVEAASGLADRGFCIVSGAAYGIDGAAHRAVLASGGITIAFLAGGVDRFYPAGHETLLTRLVERGAVVSEVPCGTAPTKWRFLQRNRLIAAASAATVVIEAGWRSGSLNTAGHAAALGRPLGAVPGPVTSPASAGCHRLIRDYDAICVTTADEMAELVVGVGVGPASSTAPSEGDATRTRVLDALSDRGGRSPERIAALSGLTVDQVRGELGRLHLDGQVGETPHGWMRRQPDS